MTDTVPVTQADRDAAAQFFRTAWHLFWPNNYDRAMKDANEIAAGQSDIWRLVQDFARHRLATIAALRAMPDEAIEAGCRAECEYFNGDGHWDQCFDDLQKENISQAFSAAITAYLDAMEKVI
jgi:hypothetical protein